MKNIKTISISIPNELILKRINSTSALKNLTRSILKVGINTENVNHYQFSRIEQMYSILGCVITEI